MSTFAEKEWFYVEHCYCCNMPFAMTVDFRNKKLKDRTSFYCPDGHSQCYIGKSEEQKLRDELEAKGRKLAEAESRAALAKAENTQIQKSHRKMRTRIMNGVCPCCNRTFQNLMMHMKSEHPDFADYSLKTLRVAFAMTQVDVAKEAGIGNATYVSLYENKKPVPEYVKTNIEEWIDRHAVKNIS